MNSVHRPLVIAHRGASGYLPEHTLEAYTLAVRQGADFIEPDLVMTRDGVLVARHENEIGSTTDVAKRFPGRRTTRLVDGVEVDGWFVEDFSLEELRSVRARERLPFRDHAHDGRMAVPTWDEILALRARLTLETGRPIGVYPETKHPTYFRSIGLPLEEPLLEALTAHGLEGFDAPVFIQSFETGNLQWLRQRTGIRLVQLLESTGGPWDWTAKGMPGSYADLTTPAGLQRVAGYADAIGPHKRLVIPEAPDGSLVAATTLVADAHAAGLLVHPWTFRSDPQFLHDAYAGIPARELRQFAALAVDGVFADFPDVAAAAFRHHGDADPG
ncbi:MAG: glycerophosphodiester phosphodiesterase [Gemmatimonadota bacterium]|nr:glycerophosphodiester phosphodiesterase [Gemmatimonadota bacterium]